MSNPGEPEAEPSAQEDVQAMEERWLEYWEEEDVHRFDPDTDKPIYAIDTPPPTVSGKMHIGHAYSYNQMDFVARYKRMRGHELFYPFGFDDNGLPSERFTTKRTGVDIHDVSRREFRQLCLEETAKAEERMEASWRRIGTSCDWELAYRTIEDHARETSQASFVELFEEDLAYRREDPTIWCPECRTAIAQVETEDAEKPSTFNDLRFDLQGDHGDGPDHLVISTTRPELLPACVAVFVHPDDPRSGDLAGRTAVVPVFGQEVPVIEDPTVDMEKGSGIVMCCTFGDLHDIEWYRAHDLPLRIAIDEAGTMTEVAERFEGLTTGEAREEILEVLDEEGVLLDQEEIVHTANVHERCGTPIEFLVTDQWFVKYLEHRDAWFQRGDEITWHPEFMKVRYDNWVEGLRWDWCISRQRVFGVPFPVWYCRECDEPYVASADELPVDPIEDEPSLDACPACGGTEWVPEEDVMDTWATSSLTPQLATDWVEDGELFDQVAPYDLRPQAHDIISFWAFNTIVKSHYHDDQAPWSDIMISGFVKLEDGKMSKSKGNIIEPMEVVSEFSGDALRYWSATGASLGEDIIYRRKDLVRGQRFITKLRNVQGFIGSILEELDEPPALDEGEIALMDRWVLAAYSDLVREVTELWEAFDYTKATKMVEEFLWHTVADHYLELVKHRVFEEHDPAAVATLYTVGLGTLKLLAPVLCFVAEDLYHGTYRHLDDEVSVHVASWPEPVLEDADALAAGEVVKEVIASVRHWKSEHGLPLNAELPTLEVVAPEDARETLVTAEATITGTLKAAGLEFVGADEVEQVPVAVKPVHAKVGPKYRNQAPKVQEALEAMDPKEAAEGDVTVELEGKQVTLEPDEYTVETRPSVHGHEVDELHVGDVTVLVPREVAER